MTKTWLSWKKTWYCCSTGQVLDVRSDLLIAGVVGMGGIGKTALAWVMISKIFSPNDIIKQLVLQIPGQPGEDQAMILTTMEGMQLPSLQVLLKQRLGGRRYFVVLDDVWEDVHWKPLAGILREGGNASRLLITSRNRDAITDAHYIHEIRTLHPIQSRELFLRTVFPDNNDAVKCPTHLEDKVGQILTKCYNLPLAIKEVGRQLIGKLHESQWEDALNRMHLCVMFNTFESSFHELPPNVWSGLLTFQSNVWWKMSLRESFAAKNGVCKQL